MGNSENSLRQFTDKMIRTLDPSFRQRWEIYDGILKRLTGSGARWLDGGCGINNAIEEFPADLTVGVDVYRHPEALHQPPNHLVLVSMESLPFSDGEFSLVSMNTVVEHFDNPEAALEEVYRVLRPGGHVLIHTTNAYSPVIILGKLLPESLRLKLMTAFSAPMNPTYSKHFTNSIRSRRSKMYVDSISKNFMRCRT
jgi:ubiquinone/menaquinone biosynthesis C-methylase UbiE